MTVPAAGEESVGPGLRGGAGLTALALVGWAVLIVVAWRVALPDRIEWQVEAAPLTGRFDTRVTPVTLLVLAFGLAMARWLPGWCLRLPWKRVLLLAAIVGLGWGVALAVTRGSAGIEAELGSRFEYPAVVAQVDEVGIGEFIDTFTEEKVLRTYPIHVQGHPLGASLLFVGLDRIGLGGAAGAALFILGVSSTAVIAVLVAVREVAGEDRARTAAPFLVLMPAVIWWVTSTDALFATVGAWGIALLVLASRPSASSRRRATLALASGLVWGLGLQISYGLAPVLLIGVAVVVARRAWVVIGWAALSGAFVMGAAALGGFWWFDGLAATRVRYFTGVAEVRPQRYFSLLGNPAAVSLALGPAAWVAIARVRDRKLALLSFAALAALAVANISGLSKAEVERIWLPFVPWVLVLAAGLVDRPDRHSFAPGWPALASGLLVGQVVLAVAIQSFVKTPW